MSSSFTEACRPTANARSSVVNQESSRLDASLFGFSARDLAIRAAAATATTAAPAAAAAATTDVSAATTAKPAAGISVLGNGARAVSRVALQRVVATPTCLREVLHSRARLSAGNHPTATPLNGMKSQRSSLGFRSVDLLPRIRTHPRAPKQPPPPHDYDGT